MIKFMTYCRIYRFQNILEKVPVFDIMSFSTKSYLLNLRSCESPFTMTQCNF